ncbi:MAG: redoxin domain-containing protein [Flavobacteriales bacterium]
MPQRTFLHRSLLFLSLLLASLSTNAQEGHRIRIHAKGLKTDTVQLAKYHGHKLYYHDTTVSQKESKYVFQGKDSIKPGVYALVSGGKKHFEFLIAEQRFTLRTEKKESIKHMDVEGSPNNKLFYQYMRKLRKENSKAKPLRSQIKTAKGKKRKKLQKKLKKIEKGVRSYQRKMAKKHQDLLVGKIIKASIRKQPPQAPDSLNKKEARRYKYRYLKKHYFDNIDLSDERLVRTPILGKKVKRYFERMIPDQPDSVIAAADRLMAQVDEGTEMYKFMANFIMNKYMNSDIMGMDAVFVHMAENYFFNGKAYWAREKTIKKWKKEIRKIKPLLIGKQAPLITLADTAGKKWISLKDVDAKYTILYFWDPECGHCQKATPKLKKAYDSLRSRGVEVYAVGTPRKTKKWKDYIEKHDLNWINVSHNPQILENPGRYAHLTDEKSLNFHKTYDIYSTPRIFLLDEDKTIIAKKLGVDQVVEHIVTLLERGNKNGASSLRRPQRKKGSMKRP